ncbi:MAG: hypothetical protein ABI903_15850 [Actinomycetota bacterium]
MTDNQDRQTFPPALNRLVEHASGQAVFGLDVLAELIKGLEEQLAAPPGFRSLGRAALGSAMWMSDPELIDVLDRMANVCVVVRKQTRDRYKQPDVAKLKLLAENGGLTQRAFPELAELAPRGGDGRAAVVGPFGPDHSEGVISAVRELGFRSTSRDKLVPMVHAKVMLVGELWWHDEHPFGYSADMMGFRPHQLWVGSPNFTTSSRASLEMGMWTSDPAMLNAARDWLLALIEMSEPLEFGSDHLEPEYLPVDYDDAAIREYMSETGWGVYLDGDD